jgi:8-oxo-dGTP diphosphatase
MVPIIEGFADSDAYTRVRTRWPAMTTTGLIVDGEGRFLLQHRDDKPGISNPGMWGSFGGELEPYETPEESFLREMQEELSWQPRRVELYGAFPLRREGEPLLLVYVFTAVLDVPRSSLVLGEGQGFDAFAPDALPERTVPELRGLIARFVGTDMYWRLLSA